MLPMHWEELALDKDKVPLSPQWDIYDKMDALGQLQIVVLRDDGKLVGYYWGFISPGLHYNTCLSATCDIFYVHPEYRCSNAGTVLFRAVEADLRRRGVHRWAVGSKLHKDCGALLRRLSFEAVETYYWKWLGD